MANFVHISYIYREVLRHKIGVLADMDLLIAKNINIYFNGTNQIKLFAINIDIWI